MTNQSSPAPLLNGRDLLRANGLSVEGPILWGRPVSGGSPGVFIVELAGPQPKVSIDPDAIRDWLNRAPELRLDGKRPTVAEIQTRLASFWLPGQSILYIGSSIKSVSIRLAGMYKTPLGERRPQPAGYWLKTLRDLNKARIWWAPVSDPELYEDTLIESFIKTVGSAPFAVLATPGGQRREHGLTAPLHDVPPPAPVKVTRVTKLPDADESQMALSSSSFRTRPTRPASLARPSRPRAAPRRQAKVPPPTTGPSAIETPVVRRSSRSAGSSNGPGGQNNAPTHLTAEGLAALHSELDELTNRRRPEVIARIKAARELGDLSENADYEAARKEQSFLEGRVQQLEQMIKSAVMIEASSEGGNEVILGSTVVVETDRHGAETFTIVGSAEADAAAGKISFTSPIGRALLGRHPGETIRVQVPAGTLDYKVVEVRLRQ
ncbi:MAG: transcription elongation factor GreA [Candidatus Limnocylindrales bacterium]